MYLHNFCIYAIFYFYFKIYKILLKYIIFILNIYIYKNYIYIIKIIYI